jgi:sensor histidine kinase YesM
MDPLAFKRMKVDKQAQTIQNEQIGKLEYLASYAPIRDSDNKIIGFLNLPYFSKQPVLQQEISSLLVTLVDLYVLIFLFVLIISLFISNTLTQPLDLIREKLRKTQLGQTNEPINWESRDELGQLIQEYNQMVETLLH